ncbi:MAG TPA: Hsp20/alpha crystallin family protein [Polyangiaceae bacterium]|nr:Hsp20/alpha crystallin family protein [Polyangiaceae bacterium]
MFGIEKAKQNAERTQAAIAPAIDVYENDTELLLLADVPGVAQNDATVTFEHDRLLIEAKAKERTYRRELVVPRTIDGEKVSANLRAGVLSVRLPKRAQYQPRQIPVQGSS